MIFIRTDANEEIATGHVMRCMTIGKELIKRGQRIRFLVSDKNSAMLLTRNHFEYIILDSQWNQPDNRYELEKIQTILQRSYEEEHKVPLLFVDSYFITNSYLKKLKPFAKLAVFDDLCREVYDVDLLINYSFACDTYDYSNLYAGRDTRLILGAQYAPLRAQFIEYSEKKQPKEKKKPFIHVLVICGGSDPLNILSKIVRAVSKESDFYRYQFHVVTGGYHSYFKELEYFNKTFHNITLYHNVENMAALMSECDIAITAGSTVLYECCAMGLPAIFFIMADNQKDSLFFVKNKSMIYAGDIRDNCECVIKNIVTSLRKLAIEDESRMRISQQIRKIVDGKGTERIVNVFSRTFEIGSFFEEEIMKIKYGGGGK